MEKANSVFFRDSVLDRAKCVIECEAPDEHYWYHLVERCSI